MLKPVVPVVLMGAVKPLPGDDRLSGIDKHPVAGPWTVTRTGFVGDAQADLKRHGGLEKALHQYPLDHYEIWSTEIGPHPLLGQPGAFGENLSTRGWTEDNVCIGDKIRFGSALLQVSQGRQPCWKLSKRFGRDDLAYAVQTTGRTGWYYRVVEEGVARSGDALVLEARARPDWPLSRLTRLLYRDTGNRHELKHMAELPELADGWRMLALRRLESSKTEDWSKRLGQDLPADLQG